MGKVKPWKRNWKTPIGPEKGGVELNSTGPDKPRYTAGYFPQDPINLDITARKKSRSKIEDKKNSDTLQD